MFHQSPAFEVLFGGAGGGGKSTALLAEALRYVGHKRYAAIIFRRTVPQLTQPMGLIDQSREMYGDRAEYNGVASRWRFPNGSVIAFGHMQFENDKFNYKGGQFAYLAFDQVEDFSQEMYQYMFSRVRTTCGCPPRIRCTANPPDENIKNVSDPTWVKRRWLPWLGTDEELAVAKLPRAKGGELLWYAKVHEMDTLVEQGYPRAMSRTFIPATVYDNPTLLATNPEYLDMLMSLPLLDRERLLHGNWNITKSGNILKREWFRFCDTYPDNLRWVRYWDLAASVKTHAHYTATCVAAFDQSTGNIYIRDMQRGKWEWPEVKKMMIDLILKEKAVTVGIEDAMQGLSLYQDLLREESLVGADVRPIHVDGDKEARVNAWSPRAESGHVYLINGSWVPGFLSEAEVFDGRAHTTDDQVDAVSGCIAMLNIPVWREQKFLAV